MASGEREADDIAWTNTCCGATHFRHSLALVATRGLIDQTDIDPERTITFAISGQSTNSIDYTATKSR
jgi:hypothetical protein